jgi:ankyrin repeat domain-containing protein 50
MLEVVSHCTSAVSVMEKLDKLPPKLDVLYDETLKRIEMQAQEYAVLAKRVLLWVTYACRPLTLRELQYVLSSDPLAAIKEPHILGANSGDPWLYWNAPKDFVPASLMLSVCCGLIIIEEEWHSDGGTFRLVRQSPLYSCCTPFAYLLIDYTALDALRRVFDKWEPSPHCRIAEFCVEQLERWNVGNRSPWATGYGRPLFLGWSTLDQGYAHQWWHIHAREAIHLPAQGDARPISSLLRFFKQCKNYVVHTEATRPTVSREYDTLTAPIHLVAHFNLPALLPFIDPNTVNRRTKAGKSALVIAAWRNNANMVKLLLKLDGIDVNVRDRKGYTALTLAEMKGYKEVVAILRLDPRTQVDQVYRSTPSSLRSRKFITQR